METPWSEVDESALRLLILGGTGKTGRALLEFAAQRGHQVTALVRAPDKLVDFKGSVNVRRGDPSRVADIQDSLIGHDAVISALGHRTLLASALLADAAKSTVQAMRETGVRRLLLVSVGMLFNGLGFWSRLLRDSLLRNIVTDSFQMERVVMESHLDWTIARPSLLTNGQPTGTYLAADGQMPQGGRAWIRRTDLANFLLNEVERPAHAEKIVGVTSVWPEIVIPESREQLKPPGYWN